MWKGLNPYFSLSYAHPWALSLSHRTSCVLSCKHPVSQSLLIGKTIGLLPLVLHFFRAPILGRHLPAFSPSCLLPLVLHFFRAPHPWTPPSAPFPCPQIGQTILIHQPNASVRRINVSNGRQPVGFRYHWTFDNYASETQAQGPQKQAPLSGGDSWSCCALRSDRTHLHVIGPKTPRRKN